jgi:GntR family transcriptional regulator
MLRLVINRTSPIPLYAQLKTCIVQAIEDRSLAPGDQLPTEDDLCQRLAISRPVIRQAYAELINDGLITRVKGRGTFVREQEMKSQFFQQLTTFEEEVRQAGKTPQVTVLLREELFDRAEVCAQMSLPEEVRIYHVRFLNLADQKIMSLVDTYLPLSLLPDLDLADFEHRSLYDILERDYNQYITHARRSVDARIVSAEEAALLKVPAGSAVHVVNTLAANPEGSVLEFSCGLYPGDRNSFDIMIYRIK